MRDQVSHPDKTTGKIMALYIVIFKFLERIKVTYSGKVNVIYVRRLGYTLVRSAER